MARKTVATKFAATAALMAAMTSAVFAGPVPQPITLKHAKGQSFDVGSKRAVAYYLAKGGVCSLTVLMADRGEDNIKGAATRVTIPVIPTRSARFDTAEGKTLEFACAPSAASMAVKILDQVAYAAK
jgi:hypothetical protein